MKKDFVKKMNREHAVVKVIETEEGNVYEVKYQPNGLTALQDFKTIEDDDEFTEFIKWCIFRKISVEVKFD